MTKFAEDTVEEAAFEWLRELGYETYTESDVMSDDEPRERPDYNTVILEGRLREALEAINPDVPPQAIDDAMRKIKSTDHPSLFVNNRSFHRMLTEGVDVSYRERGNTRHAKVWLVDFDEPENNDWLAVNQFTVFDVHSKQRHKTHRRPDIVVFINGLPLGIIELKNVADENATLHNAYNQLQTYKNDLPELNRFNEVLVIADGAEARMGTTTAGWEWFKPWKTIDGEDIEEPGRPELEVLLKGAFDRSRFLDLIRYFVVFEGDGERTIKKLAGYHQYHAVNKAVEQTIRAASPDDGDQRIGVVWHTQGSGKSLSMLFYAGKIIQDEAMGNPTIIILTDRNDLDDQLYNTFTAGQELLRQEPQQAESRDHLQELLQVASGSVVFTTIQKFRPEGRAEEYPTLSERHNIVFIADEAHRSQYGFSASVREDDEGAYLAYGFAKYVRDALPNASFIGFTGTPIEFTDANTKEVFGDYIDIYDIQRAVDDGATVPIYYEAHIIPLHIKEHMRDMLDPMFESITETAEDPFREELRDKWTRLEAAVGSQDRLAKLAATIVNHFEDRIDVMDGKGMIVCMSRRICVDLYDEIINLRPEWHDDRDEAGEIKVVMTGAASDPDYYQPHIRNKRRRKQIAERFKDPEDPLKLVLVRDMWLTGFDAPPAHTMYVDKPMHGHSLMQAIARVNRVFKDKPGGLIVDFLGISVELKEAVSTYTQSGGHGKPADYKAEAIQLMLTDFDVVDMMFHGFDYSLFHDGKPAERMMTISQGMEYILQQGPDAKKRFMDAVTRLSKSFALSTPSKEAEEIRADVAYFQAVKSVFTKATTKEGMSRDEMDSAVKQLVSQAVVSDSPISIFEAAGIKTPDISILSDEFLVEIRASEKKNLSMELLRKLINEEIKSKERSNVVKARQFSEMLEEAIRKYQNRVIDVAQVIDELVDLAVEMRDANKRGEDLGLDEEELAFYDALANNQSAIDVLGDEKLAIIATELVKAVKQNASIDWTVKQSVRAKMRVMVKRILRKFGYPPDLQDEATRTVLQQAEALAANWSA